MYFVDIEQGGVKKKLEMAHYDYYAHVITSLEYARDFALKIEKEGENDYANYQKLDMFKKSLVLYSAMTIEAFINYYATRYEIEYGAKCRNLTSAVKLKLFIELKTGNKLSNASMGSIGEIFRLRNDIAHTNATIITKAGQEVKKSIHAKLERYNFIVLVRRLNAVFTEISNLDNDEEDINQMLKDIRKPN